MSPYSTLPPAAADARPSESLSRRERQVLDALYRLQSATVSEVAAQMSEGATYDAVRAALRGLGQKCLVTHRYDGPRYVYAPAVPAEQERRRALGHVVGTYFGGSVEDAAAAVLDLASAPLAPEAVERLTRRVEHAGRAER